jgi:hypothetical protein
MSDEHVLLLIQYRQGEPLREPVHVEPLGNQRYRVLYSPGFVQGVAGGDEFILLNKDGAFEIVRRSGNLAVQVFSSQNVEPIKAELSQRVAALGGTPDGSIEQGMVFTLPLRAGFHAIEVVFNGFIAEHPELEWYYGNVYDPNDGRTPLNWWQSPDENG